MKVGDKIVIRVSAQTWADFTPYASHWVGVIEDTETSWSETLEGVDDKKTALSMAFEVYLDKFDPDKYICVVGASQADMCMEWI